VYTLQWHKFQVVRLYCNHTLFTNILDSLMVPCLVYNTAMYTVYGRCGQYGRCMVYTLAGVAGAWFIRTLNNITSPAETINGTENNNSELQ